MESDRAPDGNTAEFSSLTDAVTLMRAGFTDHAFERHSHDCFSIGVTTFGVQSFRCKQERHNSGVGDFVLFNPDEDHDGACGTADGFRYTIWYLPESFVRSCLDADAGTAGPPYFGAPHVTDPGMAAAFLALSHDLSRHALESLRAECLVRAFVGAILARHGERAHAVRGRTSNAGLARLLRVRDYMHTNFQRDLTITELAGIAGLSRAHLTRAFGAAFHVPPHVYLNTVRIAHAQTLIRRGIPLASVAAECGFADQSHFTRRFKGSVGTAPADWRRMQAVRKP